MKWIELHQNIINFQRKSTVIFSNFQRLILTRMKQFIGECFINVKLGLQMKNKEYCLNHTHLFASGLITPTPFHILRENRQLPFRLSQSVYSRREHLDKQKHFDQTSKKRQNFSLQNLSLELKKQQKLQNGEFRNSHSLRLKQLINREDKLHVEQNQSMIQTRSPFYSRQKTPQHDLKCSWQQYLNEQITHIDFTRNLNKRLINGETKEITGRTRSSRNKNIEQKMQNHEKIQRSSFYVNNFIRTRYHKKRAENKSVHQDQTTVQVQQKIQQIKPQIKEIKKKKSEKNWSMIPWEKGGENQFEDFSLM